MRRATPLTRRVRCGGCQRPDFTSAFGAQRTGWDLPLAFPVANGPIAVFSHNASITVRFRPEP
jgi:hypothetical protein